MAVSKKKTGKKSDTTTEVASPEEILAQCLVALGQGAGDLYFSPSAVRVARASYMDRIVENAETWIDDAPVILMQARAMGRIAADVASAAGASIVNGDHFADAMRLLAAGQANHLHWPFGCRWCV